jgi:hypothetical protein
MRFERSLGGMMAECHSVEVLGASEFLEHKQGK